MVVLTLAPLDLLVVMGSSPILDSLVQVAEEAVLVDLMVQVQLAQAQLEVRVTLDILQQLRMELNSIRHMV